MARQKRKAVAFLQDQYRVSVRCSCSLGMPSFPDITDDELESLRHFIRKTANETLPIYENFIAGKNHSQDSENGDAGH
jgi:hypothetical protein